MLHPCQMMEHVTNKFQLTGQNQGWVFNFRFGHLHAEHFWCYQERLPNLKLKTRPKQLLGSLPEHMPVCSINVYTLISMFQAVLKSAGSPAAALIVWAGTGVVSFLGALCYSELALMLPESGSDYTYIKRGKYYLTQSMYNPPFGASLMIILMPLAAVKARTKTKTRDTIIV